MNINSLLLRDTVLSPLTTVGSALTWAQLDSNFTTIYNEFLLQQSSQFIPVWNNTDTYNIAYNNYVMRFGKLYEYTNPTPSSNQDPVGNPAYWTERYVASIGHRQDTDTILAGGTSDEVSAAEIRAFIDAGAAPSGLPATLNVDNTTGTSDLLISSGTYVQSVDFSLGWIYSDAGEGSIGYDDNYFQATSSESIIKYNNILSFYADATGTGLIGASGVDLIAGSGLYSTSPGDFNITHLDPLKSIRINGTTVKLTQGKMYAEDLSATLELSPNVAEIKTDNDGGLRVASGLVSLSASVNMDITSIGNIGISSAGITADRALYVDSSGFLVTSSVTPTELGYLSGATSSIQNQINALTTGLFWKAAVRVATTVAGTLATSFENGDTIDGVVLATGDRILIKNQVTASENGIYVVNASGAPTRATDFDSGADNLSGSTVAVQEGTTNADLQFVCSTNAPITIGVTSISFVLVGGTTYVGTTNRVTVTGNVIDIAATYVGQTSITTVGTIGTGTWQGSPIADAYISSSATWNGYSDLIDFSLINNFRSIYNY